jgi:vibriolysin
MDYQEWTMEVPAGESELVLELSGGSISGGFALYVAQGSSVGELSSQYDCRLTSRPNRCVFTNPAAGTWSIMTKSYYGSYVNGSYSNVKVAVNP